MTDNYNFTISVDQSFPSNALPDVEQIKKSAPSYGNAGRPVQSWFDGYRRQRLPEKNILVGEYKRLAYTCSNINAGSVACAKLKLFIKKDKATKSLLRKGIETKAVSSETIDWLTDQSYLQKTLASFTDIEEVVKHPVLDLLEHVNTQQNTNSFNLREFTQLYQEITGEAYWLIENDRVFGRPINIWLLPSQYVTPVKQSQNTKKLIDFYEYRPPGSSKTVRYRPEDIIDYLMPSLNNPFVTGVSPLEAAFDASEVNNKLLTLEDAMLENQGRPDAILTPDKESSIGTEEARRLEREYEMRFGKGRQGGIWVVEEDMNLTPLSFKPSDIARLEIAKWSKNDMANAYQIPYALISDTNNNRQQLEAAEMQHARHGIMPRLKRDAAKKNSQLLTRYDDTGTLFFAYENPVPEDQEAKLQENVQLKMNGIITPNEVRKEYNRKPLPGGDELETMNVSPDLARENKAKSGDDDRSKKGSNNKKGANGK